MGFGELFIFLYILWCLRTGVYSTVTCYIFFPGMYYTFLYFCFSILISINARFVFFFDEFRWNWWKYLQPYCVLFCSCEKWLNICLEREFESQKSILNWKFKLIWLLGERKTNEYGTELDRRLIQPMARWSGYERVVPGNEKKLYNTKVLLLKVPFGYLKEKKKNISLLVMSRLVEPHK